MFVKLHVFDAQCVRIEFMDPIPLHVYNMLRRAVYAHAPVWAFDSVVVTSNPFHNVTPSELIEGRLKHVVLSCKSFPMHIMQMYKVKACLKPLRVGAQAICTSDIDFKSPMGYAMANPVAEFGISASPNVKVVNVSAESGKTNVEAVLEASFASAFERGDTSQRYGVYNVQIETGAPNDEVKSMVYSARGHFQDKPDVIFQMGMQRLQDHIAIIEEAFLLHAEM